MKQADNRILWLSVVGTDEFNAPTREYLQSAAGAGTQVDVISFPKGPHHVEFHSYEAMMMPDIVRTVFHNREKYDAFIIGCFYDPGLDAAREISGSSVVAAPCESALAVATSLGNSFFGYCRPAQVDSENERECPQIPSSGATGFFSLARSGRAGLPLR